MSKIVKLEVQKRTSWNGKMWEAGEIIKASAGEAGEYPLKGMVDTGIVGEIESEDPQEQDVSSIEGNNPEDPTLTGSTGENFEEQRKPLEKGELTEIDGIGPSYAESILEKYETVERLLEAPDEEIAELHGITPELASKVKEELR